MLDFGNSNFSTVWTVKRPILHNHAKFREDRSIHCCDIAIFVIFKMAAAAILVFEKLEILMIYGDNLRQRAKFHQNRSNGCWDMALIFRAFGLKTPIHAPKIGVLGGFDSLSREQY